MGINNRICLAVLWIYFFLLLHVGTDDPIYTVIVPPPDFLKPQRPACVSNCRGVPNGDYPSCEGCLFFTTCSNGYIFPARPCSWFNGLYWNDKRKRCDYSPAFCFEWDDDDTFKPSCVSTCEDMQDGDYQSCHGCHVYLSCVAGLMYDQRICPYGLVWDDYMKRCEWVSNTCSSRKRSLHDKGPPIEDFSSRRFQWDPFTGKYIPKLQLMMQPKIKVKRIGRQLNSNSNSKTRQRHRTISSVSKDRRFQQDSSFSQQKSVANLGFPKPLRISTNSASKPGTNLRTHRYFRQRSGKPYATLRNIRRRNMGLHNNRERVMFTSTRLYKKNVLKPKGSNYKNSNRKEKNDQTNASRHVKWQSVVGKRNTDNTGSMTNRQRQIRYLLQQGPVG